MRNWLVLLLCALLAACAGPQTATRPPSFLFDDTLFAAPSERISADHIFAPSERMRQYLARPDVVAQLRRKGLQRGLLDALYENGELKIDYDATLTRTAAEAFDARAGNCISLVVMTAAFARELGLNVRFRAAVADEIVSRNRNLLLRSGHVNVSLGRRLDAMNSYQESLTVDFLPAEELKGLRTREIAENTVVAMFMNNRAVEAMVAGRLDDAYGWVREAVQHDPDFLGALNTLGVVYLRRGSLDRSSIVFGHVLERDPADRAALANLANAYARMGRIEESMGMQRRLARLEAEPPLHHFHLGLAAMKKQDFVTAREHFTRESRRSEGNHELHYWLGLVHLQLGEIEQARRQLAIALQASPTLSERDLYSAKLQWIAERRGR